MKKIDETKFLQLLEAHSGKEEMLDLRGLSLEAQCLDNKDLSYIDFSWGEFRNISFRGCRFDYSVLDHTKFCNADFSASSFRFASLFGADLRGCCMADTDCTGSNFLAALLSKADLRGLKHTESTLHFRNHCPETGYFIGYKKCFNNRLVKLLIPKDAKRSSATTPACRCDKARVVAISDLDGGGFYREAISFVDENFVYRLGDTVYADGYNEDRWLESSKGIHFWLSKEEAIAYM